MRIETFLVCDDIRNEIGGKHSLMGIYNEEIIFYVTPENKGMWPKQKSFGFFSKFFTEGKKPNSFQFKMLYNGVEKVIGKGEFPPQVVESNQKSITIAMMHTNFTIPGAGEFNFVFDFFDDKGQPMSSIKAPFTISFNEKIVEQ